MQSDTKVTPHEPSHDVHHHEDLGFWRSYIFSTDHKVIGIQYAMTALVFLFIGFLLIGAMRWQMAYPGKAIPIVGGVMQSMFGDTMVGNEVNPENISEPEAN